MILTQTWAMFVDAYRELNSKKLFWITLGLSIIVVLACAMLGINDRGITLLVWTLGDIEFLNSKVIAPQLFYKFLFASVAIPLWLTWAATILAIISTAGIIPEFVSGGAIEMSLSKPIGRLRLLLTKYATALLFVALQVFVFTLGWFILIGIRGHSWEPRLFLAVPIVLVFFSYLYGVCALVGLVTRSAIASILITALFWLVIFAVHVTEQQFLTLKLRDELRQQKVSAYIESLRAQRERQEQDAAKDHRVLDPSIIATNESSIKLRESQLAELREIAPGNRLWHRISFATMSVLPKTSETVALLNRWLLSSDEMSKFVPSETEEATPLDRRDKYGVSGRMLARAKEDATRHRGLLWVLGTSFLFEGVVVATMCVIFRRRDF
jgi:ABC-type transport system involved in multi-copper enzyme maturation permease subunit